MDDVNNTQDDISVSVLQLKDPGECGYGFLSYDYAKDKLNLADYEVVAKVVIPEEIIEEVNDSRNINNLLEYVFAYGNTNKDYYENNPDARSISVSDILEYKANKYYVDSFGFVYIGKGDKLTEAEIHTNQSNNDLEKEKEDIKQQLQDVEEIETMKKELDDKMNELFEDNSNKCVMCGSNDLNGCYSVKGFSICKKCGQTVPSGIIFDKIETLKDNRKVEAKITDYINEKELDDIIKTNSILNVANSYKILDDMILQIKTDTGYSYYKIIKNDDDSLEAYWISSDGKKLGDTFILKEAKTIKVESQVSNYTLEEIGQCLKDKGNDFKLQITGADSKTKWLNIDKDDVQKIYNTLSYKKKKTESLDTTVDLFEQAKVDDISEYREIQPKTVIKESKDNSFPSSDFSSEKLSYSDIEESFDTFSEFKKFITSEQERWLIENGFSVNELYEGLKEILTTFKSSAFKEIISIDEYIEELNNSDLLNESLNEEDVDNIKEGSRSPNYFKGLKLKEDIIEAWQNKDLKTAYQKWSELYDLFSSGFDKDGNITDDYRESKVFRDHYELSLIMKEIPDQCVYDVTDYIKTQSYKKYEEIVDDREARTNYIKTLYDYLERNNLLEDGVDTGDTDIDMEVYFGLPEEVTDDYDKFISNLAKVLEVVSPQDDYCVVDYSKFVRDNEESFKEIFNYDVADIVELGIPDLISGNYSDDVYKKLNDLIFNNKLIESKDDTEIFNGDTEVNLKLIDGTIIHIACDSNGEGYYYEIYDKDGNEIDGGLIEYEDGEVDRDVPVKEVIERISDFISVPEILNDSTIRMSDEDYIKATSPAEETNTFKDSYYILPDGKLLKVQLSLSESGIDYTLYNEDGTENDGGILEFDVENDVSNEDVLSALLKFIDMENINISDVEEIDEETFDNMVDD